MTLAPQSSISVRRVLSLLLALFVFAAPAAIARGQDADARKAQAAKEPAKDFEKEGGDEGDYIRNRQKWFHDQRAYPRKTIPAAIRQRAIKARDAKVAVEMAAKAKLVRPASAPASPQWTLVGPNAISFWALSSGRVTSLAVDPTNAKIVYAGGAEGGVWKTTDGGNTWAPLTDTQTSLAIGSLAIDPSHPATIYAGTGEENFSGDSYYGAGVLKSTDGGATWTQYCGPFCGPEFVNGYADPGAYIGGMAVDPSNSNVVLAAVELWGAHGIYRSANGGATWTLVVANQGYGLSVYFSPANGNLAYAATSNGGVLKSTDAGQTWTASNGSGATALPAPTGARVALAMAASSPNVLYLGVTNSSSSALLGIYKSTDGGTSWNQLASATDYCGGQCWYDNVLAVSPVDPNFVVGGGDWAYSPGNSAALVSLDGGATWTDQSQGLHPDTHAFAFSADGTVLYTGTDGGVFNTTAPTQSAITWASLNANLAITEFYPGISLDPANVNHTYVGTQDNGSQKYLGANNWQYVDCGDGGATAIDFATPANIYVNCIGATLDKSTDDGATFNSAVNGINTGDRTAWVPPLAMDPENSHTLYFGTYQAYQSTNGAGNWTSISPDLTAGGELSVLAVAPTDSNTVYSGSDDGQVFVTRNALSGTAATWTNVTSSASLPNRTVDWIAVDPAVPTTAYVVYNGFTGFGDNLGHVFKTTDAGAAWTDISSDLPNTPVDAILVDPDAPSTLFIGTDIGAFYTTTGGASWSVLGTGLPNVVVTGLALHNPSRTLRASTHGRSVWDLNIATLLPVPSVLSTSPAKVFVASGQFTLTVNGVQFDSASVVEWNGTALATAFVNSGQLTAVVPAADVATAGTAAINVFNADTAKLSNAFTFTIDNVVPGLTSISPNSAIVGGPAFTLTANGSSFVKGATALLNGNTLATTFISSSQLTATMPAHGIAATGTFNVTVSNPAPGGGASTALPFSVLNPAPASTSLSPASVTAGGGAFTLFVNGSSFVSGAVVRWNGASLPTTLYNNTQVYATVPAADIALAGTSTITVANPTPGGGTTAPLTFTIDNPSPYVSSLSPSSVTAGATSVSFTLSGGNFVQSSTVNWNGTALPASVISGKNATTIAFTLPSSYFAAYGTAQVTVTNAAPGGGTTGALTFTIDNPAPSLKSISPVSAIAGGASFTLTVSGSNLVKSSQIEWNGKALATSFVSSTEITATVPAANIASAGTATVSVANPSPGGGATAGATFTTDNPVPAVASISPSSIIVPGAQSTLTVNGSNFVATSKILWNGSALTTNFVNTGQLTATLLVAQLKTAGTATVAVQNPAPGGGVSNSLAFTLDNPVPTSISLAPASKGAGSAAFSLSMYGKGFAAGAALKWNGVALPTTLASATQVYATIPAADVALAATVSVTVTNPGPGGGTTAPLTLTITNPSPNISALSPNSAVAGAGKTAVTLTGSNFVQSSIVSWNGTALPSSIISGLNATQMTLNLPASYFASAGTAQVMVTNPTPGGGQSGKLTFTIDNPAPIATAISPSSATHGAAAFTLTVTGTNFVSASQIKWNGGVLATTYASAAKLTATVPAADIANAGTASVTVFNPTPGGGASTALSFSIK